MLNFYANKPKKQRYNLGNIIIYQSFFFIIDNHLFLI